MGSELWGFRFQGSGFGFRVSVFFWFRISGFGVRVSGFGGAALCAFMKDHRDAPATKRTWRLGDGVEGEWIFARG